MKIFCTVFCPNQTKNVDKTPQFSKFLSKVYLPLNQSQISSQFLIRLAERFSMQKIV